jgi:hypothetical protein
VRAKQRDGHPDADHHGPDPDQIREPVTAQQRRVERMVATQQ